MAGAGPPTHRLPGLAPGTPVRVTIPSDALIIYLDDARPPI
ncbi:hypothetical protein [Frankia gtarii]|nr:hypothetical protein [Frankia gtarii]